MLTLQDLTLLLTRGITKNVWDLGKKWRQNIHFCYWVEPPGGLRILYAIMGFGENKKTTIETVASSTKFPHQPGTTGFKVFAVLFS